jgi:hypothetical protein
VSWSKEVVTIVCGGPPPRSARTLHSRTLYKPSPPLLSVVSGESEDVRIVRKGMDQNGMRGEWYVVR